jgi:hypothetical protein
MGLVVGIGEIAGGFGFPTIAGRIADHTSLAAPMFMQLGCAIVGGVLAMFLIETAPIKVAQRAASGRSLATG